MMPKGKNGGRKRHCRRLATCPDQHLLSASLMLLLTEERVVSCVGNNSQKKGASSDSPVKDAAESGDPG